MVTLRTGGLCGYEASMCDFLCGDHGDAIFHREIISFLHRVVGFFPQKKDDPASESLVECSGPSALEKLILLIFRISLFGFYSSIIFSVASFKCQTRIQTQVGSLSHWTRIFPSIFVAVVFPIQWMGIRLVHHGLLIRRGIPPIVII